MTKTTIYSDYRSAQRKADRMRPVPGKVIHHPRQCADKPGLHVSMHDLEEAARTGCNHAHGTIGCNASLTVPDPFYTVKPLGPVTAAARLQELDAISKLRKMVRPGDKVYTKLLHRSSSGMFRVVDVILIQRNQPRNITYWVCKAGIADWNDKHEGAAAPGCGTDVGFEVVYHMGSTLYPDGFTCPGDKCRSNEHINDRNCPRKRGYKHKGGGGYALAHEWM